MFIIIPGPTAALNVHIRRPPLLTHLRSASVTAEGYAEPWANKVFGPLTFQAYIDPSKFGICTPDRLS